jgi:hypothetical protein
LRELVGEIERAARRRNKIIGTLEPRGGEADNKWKGLKVRDDLVGR